MARRTFQDVLAYVAYKLGMRYPTGSPALAGDRLAQVKRIINLRQQSIAGAEPWNGLVAHVTVATSRKYNTGTVTLVEDSASVVGSGVVWAAGHVGWFFTGPDGVRNIVSTVTPTTDLTIKSNYTGASASGAAYTLIKAEHLLPADVDKVWFVTDQSAGRTLKYKRLADMFRDEPSLETEAQPDYYCVSGVSGDTRKLFLYPLVTDLRTLMVVYNKAVDDMSADADYPGVPEELHTLLMYDAAFAVLDEFKKGDEKALASARALADAEWAQCRVRYVSLGKELMQMAKQEDGGDEDLSGTLMSIRE